MHTGVMAAFDYLFGLGVFGFLYWLLNGILVEIRPVSETGDLLTFANWLWWGAIVLYLIFGMFWLPRKVKEYPPGGGDYYR